MNGSSAVSQRQCACLLAHALCGSMPSHDAAFEGNGMAAANSKDETAVHLLFWREGELQKMKCLLTYFVEIKRRVDADAAWTGRQVVFARHSVPALSSGDELDEWAPAKAQLRLFEPHVQGEIENGAGVGCLQADFANEYIGGGVLHGAMVQEEIRFTIAPECLVSLMLCEVMLPNEAIFIKGTEMYSKYTGYSRSFEFDGPRSSEDSLIVALDAMCYRGRRGQAATQYGESATLRELSKLVAALTPFEGLEARGDDGCLPAFATGNWGCGAFRGDPQYKSLLQWAAASACGRDAKYFYFGDKRLEQLPEAIQVSFCFGLTFTSLANCKMTRARWIRALVRRRSKPQSSTSASCWRFCSLTRATRTT